jgi:hypothetical protein
MCEKIKAGSVAALSHAVPPPGAALAASLSLAIGGVVLAASGTPVRPAIAQKQLVSRTSCETAADAKAKPDFLSRSLQYRDDVLITTRYCSATAHNQLTPTKPEIVVVSANPQASSKDRIFITTIPKTDAKKVHDTCVLAGQAAFDYSQASTTGTPPTDAVIAGAEVLTGAGKVDCEGFLRATTADNPLVVFAPGVFTGTVISVPILNMIGNNKPAAEVQAAVDHLGRQLAGPTAMSADEIRTRPQIISAAPGQYLP